MTGIHIQYLVKIARICWQIGSTPISHLFELDESDDRDVDHPWVGRGVLVPFVGLGLGAEGLVGVVQALLNLQQPGEGQSGGVGAQAVEAGPLIA